MLQNANICQLFDGCNTMTMELDDRPYRLGELQELGYSRMQVLRLVKEGSLVKGVRGVYRPAAAAPSDARYNWAEITVAKPGAVFCLFSAAVFHGISEYGGARRYIAVPSSYSFPRTTQNETCLRWADQRSFEIGVETTEIDGVAVKITSPARTLVDFFRYSTLCAKDGRVKKIIDPESFHDVLAKYLGKFGSPGIQVHRIAKAFGIAKEMSNVIQLVQMSRPDLWQPIDADGDGLKPKMP